MYCTTCGKKLPDDAIRCDECGTPVAGRNQNTQDNENQNGFYQDNRDTQSSYSYQYSYENQGQSVYEKKSGARKGFAIASMVLGIIGVVGSCCSLATAGIMSILMGIIGLIFGILGLKSDGKGFAIAGIIMACVNILIGILLLILIIFSMEITSNLTPEELEMMMESLEHLELILIR